MDEKTVTIQQTSKKIKAAILVEWFVFFLGVILIATAPDSATETATTGTMFGSLFIVGGLISLVVTYILKWWHHS